VYSSNYSKPRLGVVSLLFWFFASNTQPVVSAIHLPNLGESYFSPIPTGFIGQNRRPLMRRTRFIYFLLLSSLSLLFSPHLYAQEVTDTLSNVRDNIVFPDLTDSEKLVVAEQAQLLLRGVYVHRFQKQDFYPGILDPVPAVQAVVDNIDNLTVAEMEAELYRIFSSQRDLHLNYIFPQPYASFRSFLPLTLKRVKGRRSFFEVYVDSVNAEDFATYASDQRVPEVGDQIVAYNGVPIRQAVNSMLEIGQGANRFGGFSRALARLTFKPHLLTLVPEENEVSITFKTKKAGRFGRRSERYTITLPWITTGPPPVAATPQLQRSATVTSQQETTIPRKFTQKDLNIKEDMFQKLFNDFRAQRGLVARSTYPSNPSNEPEITWGVIENRLGKFGYIRLASFVPENGVDFAVQEVRRIIFDEFDGTRGMIFDVRDNGGGFGQLSDELPQLFGRNEAVSAADRLINTDEMSRIFNESIFGPVFPAGLEAINEVSGTDATHTRVFNLFDAPGLNTFGQVYNGPVAVLANSNSYSASDFFSCHMQDSGIGFLFGEEPRTGAGGANVFEHSLLVQFVPTVFTPLPATHRARVSFGQAVRQGLNEGEFIEDFGCEADLLVSPRLSDLLDGGENQIARITSALTYLSFFPRFRPAVRAPSNEFLLLRNNGDLNFPLRVTNTPKVRVTINDEVVDEIFTRRFFGTSNLDYSFPDTLSVGETNSVLIEGVSYSGRRLWNLKRQVVVLEESVEVGAEGLEIDFSTATTVAPFSIINFNPAEDGWNLVTPALQIGFNPTYASNVNSDAILSVDLTALPTAQLSFDMEFDTETDFDFIEVFVTDSDGNNSLLLRESGAQPLQTFDFDISQFAGKSGVQVHFRFISDTNVEAPGVRLQRVSIR